MKRRSPFLIALVLIASLIVSGCMGNNQLGQGDIVPTPTPEPTRQPMEPTITPEQSPDVEEDTQAPDEDSNASEQLKALLPNKEGYKWVYNGFAEYGHVLDLEEKQEENGKAVYLATGEVDDMSDGESDHDFSLNVTFTVTEDSLIQEKSGDMMMDLFDNMVLIQTPLEEGHTWTQRVSDEIELECTIEKIEEVDGAKVYTVLYDDKSSPYFEQREIREGTGVVSFTRMFISEDDSFEVSYFLYEEASGYEK